MVPRGFEPPTPGLKGRCSDQAELRNHPAGNKSIFLNAFVKIIYYRNLLKSLRLVSNLKV